MSQFETREERGIYVHVLPTQKYRFNTIVATLTQELQEETATPLAILPYVLMRGSQHYPTPEKLQLALDDLYGASLGGTIDKKGERHIVDFTMDVPNEKFLATGESLFQKALGILADIIMNPLTENGGFTPQHVQAEQEQQKKRISAMINDKMQFARERCLSEMTKGQPYSIPRLGHMDQVDSVTPQGLYELYQQVLKTAPMHIYVIGDVEVDEVAKQIFSTFQFDRQPITEFRTIETPHDTREAQEVVDRMEVNQGKLNLGYWTNVDYASDDYLALLVMNGIFGAFPHSKLFINVREKNSLAYYSSSYVDGLKGIIHAASGVEFKNFEKALNIINEQLELMRQGEISDEELSFTIKGLVNNAKTAMDSPTGLADLHLTGLIAGRVRPQEESIELIQKVTKEDVIRIAKGVRLDTVYMLRNKEGNEHA